MDGTLLDLKFDNWFWQQHVPRAYAATRGMTESEAGRLLRPRFAAAHGRLEWYCIDHWSRELGLDIRALKHDVREQVEFLPGATQFLARLARSGKRRILVTNAHPETLAIKDRHVGLGPWLDELHSTHSYGVPKEVPEFWPRLAERVAFDPARTLFVDDSLPVLAAARGYGIRWLRAIRWPDRAQPARDSGDFPGVDSVADLWPGQDH
jgi:putative hydrolase of the HAD superfamily